MSLLYTGGPFKQANGSSITSVSTRVNLGSMKANSSQSGVLHTVATSYGDNENTRVVGGVDLGQADWGSFVNATGASASGITNGTGQWAGLAVLNATAHGLVVGGTVNIRNTATGASTTGLYNGIHRVRDVSASNTAILNVQFVSTATGVVYALPVGNVAHQPTRNFLFMKSLGQTHGVNNTKLGSAASDYGRAKVHKVRAIRTQQVATAMRAGNFVSISGKFSTQPTQSEDYASMGTDDVTVNNTTNYGLKGELVYRYGGPSGNMSDYNGKTA